MTARRATLLALVLAVSAVAAVDVPDVPVPTAASVQALLEAEVAAGRDPVLKFLGGTLQLEAPLRLLPGTRLEGVTGGTRISWAAGQGSGLPMFYVQRPDSDYPLDTVPQQLSEVPAPEEYADRQMVTSFTTSLAMNDLVVDHTGSSGGAPVIALGGRDLVLQRAQYFDNVTYDEEGPPDAPPLSTVRLWYNSTDTFREVARLKDTAFTRVDFTLGPNNAGATVLDARDAAYRHLASPALVTDTCVASEAADGDLALDNVAFDQCIFRLFSTGQTALMLAVRSRRVTVRSSDFYLDSGGAAAVVALEPADGLALDSCFIDTRGASHAALDVRAGNLLKVTGLTVQAAVGTGSACLRLGATGDSHCGDGVTEALVDSLACDDATYGVVLDRGTRGVSVRDSQVAEAGKSAVVAKNGTVSASFWRSTLSSISPHSADATVLVEGGTDGLLFSECAVTRVRTGEYAASCVAVESGGVGLSRLVGCRLEHCSDGVTAESPIRVHDSELTARAAVVRFGPGIGEQLKPSTVSNNRIACERSSTKVFYLEATQTRSLLSGNYVDASCEGRDTVETPQVTHTFLETGTVRVPSAEQPVSPGVYFARVEDRTYVRKEEL